MSRLRIERYSQKYYAKWNRFVEESCNGTIFHRLDFLEYHGEKYNGNEHNLIWFKGETFFALMPMAVFEEYGVKIAKSPYGASFGGIVYHKIKLRECIQMIELLVQYFNTESISKCYITLVPDVYSSDINNYIEYALSYNNFKVLSRDLFNIIELPDNYESAWQRYEGRARTTIRKVKDCFELQENVNVEDFYPILQEDKNRHNNAIPTHSIHELLWLKRYFNRRISFDIATHSNGGKAGICYIICNSNIILTFYMAQQNEVLGLNGKNLLVDLGIKRAIDYKIKYFDFGGSSLGYEIENFGVAEFKESFGAKGYLRETYYWVNH